MFEEILWLEILGLLLVVSSFIVAGHTLVERIFNYSSIVVLTEYLPKFLKAYIPSNAFITWYEIRSLRLNFYGDWHVVLFLTGCTTLTFALFSGFWALLVLKVLGFNISNYWLLSYCLFLAFIYFWSSINQTFIKMAILHKDELTFIRNTHNNIDTNDMIGVFVKYPKQIMRYIVLYFFVNWVKSPVTSLGILLVLMLLVVMHWPAWLTNVLPNRYHIDITNSDTRRNYYIGYFVSAGVLGTILLFIGSRI